MIKLLISMVLILLAILGAAYLGEWAIEAAAPLMNNKWVPIISMGTVVFLLAIALGAGPKGVLRRWAKDIRLDGGVRRWFIKKIDAAEPELISISGKIQAFSLIVAWLAGVFAALHFITSKPDLINKGIGTLITGLIIGWGAMLASFNAYLAVSLKAEDERRKDHRELTARKRNTLLLAEHMARKFTPLAERVKKSINRREIQLFGEEFDEEDKEYIDAKNLEYFTINTPPQLERLWDNLGIIPMDLADALRDLTMHLEEFQRILSDETRTDETVKYMIGCDDLITNLEGAIQSSNKIIKVVDASLR